MLPIILFASVLSLPTAVLGVPSFRGEVIACMRPGRGRHRRIDRSRHAVRGGVRR